MKVSFNWVKDYVQVKGSASSVADRLTMSGLEVKKLEAAGDDVLFETEITTNRPDWLSHLGVAREIHAVLGGKFKIPPFANKRPHPAATSRFSVAIPEEDRPLCPYYSACLVENVAWGATPGYIKHRLEACGIRSINLVVDITNYVLLEWGQPLHAFDADRLSGNQIVARRARLDEKMTAIDGNCYDLMSDDLIIADGTGPIAIGGVMGGEGSEVHEGTKNILLESAYFAPSTVRRTSRRLKLASESSYRFERGVDPKGVDEARERAIYLLRKHASVGQIGPVLDSGRLELSERSVALELSSIEKVIGTDIPSAKVKTYLSRLGLKVSGTSKKLRVKVPTFRSDLSRSIDLLEEVTRLHGYDQVPETLPCFSPMAPPVNPLLRLESNVRGLATGLGFYEAVTFSVVDPAPFEKLGLAKNQWTTIKNPQNKELTLMRPNLLSGLLAAVCQNFRMGESRIRVFEVGNRYLSVGVGELPLEERMVGLAMSGRGRANWLEPKRDVNFYDLKGIVDELLRHLNVCDCSFETLPESIFESGRGVSVRAGEKALGFFGELSERTRQLFDVDEPVFFAELSLEKILDLPGRPKGFTELPKFPGSPRDLSLIVSKDVQAGPIMAMILQHGDSLVLEVRAIDCFEGGKYGSGKKSLTFRIFYQANDRTLESEEVNQLHFSIIDRLTREFQAKLP